MKIGDLVKVNKWSNAGGLWGQIGIVMGRKKRYEPGKSPLIEVLLNGNRRLFEFCSLDVISENR